MDPHAVLGVPRTASPAEIRAAYLRRAKALHPDLAPPGPARTAAETQFKQLAAAYAAARRGGPAATTTTAAWAAPAAAAAAARRPAPAFGNVALAMVLSVPLALAGVAAASARPAAASAAGAGGWDRALYPPDNPFLAEGARPRMVSPRLKWWPPPGLRGEGRAEGVKGRDGE